MLFKAPHFKLQSRWSADSCTELSHRCTESTGKAGLHGLGVERRRAGICSLRVLWASLEFRDTPLLGRGLSRILYATVSVARCRGKVSLREFAESQIPALTRPPVHCACLSSHVSVHVRGRSSSFAPMPGTRFSERAKGPKGRARKGLGSHSDRSAAEE